MGQAFRKLFDSIFGNSEIRVVMVGLDNAGKTTILYKLQIGKVVSTIPTVAWKTYLRCIVSGSRLCLKLMRSVEDVSEQYWKCYFQKQQPSLIPRSFNVEKVEYKNVDFTVWDLGGQGLHKLRPLWKHYFTNTYGLIYVVDSLERERLDQAKEEFQTIINEPTMLNNIILVFANKQDLKGAMTITEVCEGLGLFDLRNRKWHIQGTCALKGDGLFEGLDWLASTLKERKASEYSSM